MVHTYSTYIPIAACVQPCMLPHARDDSTLPVTKHSARLQPLSLLRRALVHARSLARALSLTARGWGSTGLPPSAASTAPPAAAARAASRSGTPRRHAGRRPPAPRPRGPRGAPPLARRRWASAGRPPCRRCAPTCGTTPARRPASSAVQCARNGLGAVHCALCGAGGHLSSTAAAAWRIACSTRTVPRARWCAVHGTRCDLRARGVALRRHRLGAHELISMPSACHQ